MERSYNVLFWFPKK